MIKSFKNRDLETLFFEGKTKRIPPKHTERIGMILDLLNAAAVPSDMNFPGSKFHPLKGDRKGQYAVEVSGNWRIVFKFEASDIYEVDYIDYH